MENRFRRTALSSAVLLVLAGAPLPAAHAAVGDAVGDPITVVTQSYIYQAGVAMGADGNFTVVWYDDDTSAHAACFDADGNPIGSQQTLSSAGRMVRVAADADGNSVAVWTMDDGSDDLGVQRLDSSCNPQGDPITITTTTYVNTFPGVAMGPQGDFVVVWYDRSVNEIHFQRYDADGTPQGGVVTVAAGTLGAPFAAARADGGFVVGWSDTGDGYLRYYAADGSALTGAIKNSSLGPTSARYQSVAMDGDGDVVLPWYDYDQGGTGYGIYAQRYDASGNANGSQLLASVANGPGGHDDGHWAAVDDDGDFMVVWETSSGIYARRYDSADTAGDEINLTSGTNPDVAMDADGDAVVVWDSGPAIMAQRYEGKGQTVDLGVVAGSDAGGLIGGGEAITYTYTVTNNGSGSALDITLESVSPDELTYASLSADTDWDCAESGGTVTCTLPRMVSGGSASLTVSYTNATVSDGNLVNTVSVSTPMSDTDSSNDSATVTLPTTLNAAPGFDSTPAISGSAAVGNTVSVDTPVTEPDGDDYTVTYQWYADGAAITGATGDSYSVSVTTDEAHTTLTVTLTATDSNGYSATATASGVAVANAAPSFDATPSIDGTGLVGNTLTVVDTATSDTDADSVTLSYQWQADGVDISGATAESYTLTSAEAHSAITAVVTAADGYDTTVITTAPTAMDNSAPEISGVDISGSTSPGETVIVVVSGVDRDGDPLTYSYEWYVDGALSGTAASYTVADGDEGKTLFAIVTVSDGNGGSDRAASTARVIGNEGPVFLGTPSISGTAAVGNTLGLSGTAVSDAEGDAVTIGYQWLLDDAPIDGATADSYTIQSSDAGHAIACTVTIADGKGGSTSVTTAAKTVDADSGAAGTGASGGGGGAIGWLGLLGGLVAFIRRRRGTRAD